MNKYLHTLTAICICFNLSSCATDDLELSGNTDYSRSSGEVLTQSLEVKYRQPIYEPKHSKYMVYLGGKVLVDYDVFNRESRANALSTVGVEF
jgi:hypothetical protein